MTIKGMPSSNAIKALDPKTVINIVDTHYKNETDLDHCVSLYVRHENKTRVEEAIRTYYKRSELVEFGESKWDTFITKLPLTAPCFQTFEPWWYMDQYYNKNSFVSSNNAIRFTANAFTAQPARNSAALNPAATVYYPSNKKTVYAV
jgi:hypothetical protein